MSPRVNATVTNIKRLQTEAKLNTIAAQKIAQLSKDITNLRCIVQKLEHVWNKYLLNTKKLNVFFLLVDLPDKQFPNYYFLWRYNENKRECYSKIPRISDTCYSAIQNAKILGVAVLCDFRALEWQIDRNLQD